MKPATKILRIVALDNGGPRKRNILEGMARHYGAGPELIDQMIAAGQLVKHGDRRGSTWGLPKAAGARQRGFVLPMPLVYLLAAAAVLGALWGLYAAVDGRGYKRGAAEKQAEWDEANRKAAALARAREQDVSDAIKEKDAQRSVAVERAADSDIRWQEAKRELRRQGGDLATCTGTPRGAPGAPVAPAGPGPDPGGVRFTWGFVRLYDGAWTGPGGQPVFAAAAGPDAGAGAGAAASAGAGAGGLDGRASQYGPDELLDVHGENARRASACRRDYDALIDKIRAAEAAWEKRSRAPP